MVATILTTIAFAGHFFARQARRISTTPPPLTVLFMGRRANPIHTDFAGGYVPLHDARIPSCTGQLPFITWWNSH
jgi:hypothetical protein